MRACECGCGREIVLGRRRFFSQQCTQRAFNRRQTKKTTRGVRRSRAKLQPVDPYETRLLREIKAHSGPRPCVSSEPAHRRHPRYVAPKAVPAEFQEGRPDLDAVRRRLGLEKS